MSASLGLRSTDPADSPSRERHVVQDGQVRKKIELLKHHPDALPNRRHVRTLARDLLALEEDPTGVERLEQIHAAEQGALTATARSNDDEHLADGNIEVDPVEDEIVAEALPNSLEANNPTGRPQRRRSREFVCHRSLPCGHSSTQPVARRSRRAPIEEWLVRTS